jgi:two-component system, response regulator PdtaR
MKNNNSNYNDKRVLIMEDDLILTLSLELMLKNAGIQQMIRAETGEEAIEKVTSEDVDLIIADIYLGEGISGTQAVMKIQNEKKIPVIYITGNSDFQNRELAEKTDFVDYLVKPISNDKLRNTLAKVWQVSNELK